MCFKLNTKALLKKKFTLFSIENGKYQWHGVDHFGTAILVLPSDFLKKSRKWCVFILVVLALLGVLYVLWQISNSKIGIDFSIVQFNKTIGSGNTTIFGKKFCFWVRC